MRILAADPAMPYARQPLSKDFLCCRAADSTCTPPSGWRRAVVHSRGHHVSVRWLAPTVS